MNAGGPYSPSPPTILPFYPFALYCNQLLSCLQQSRRIASVIIFSYENVGLGCTALKDRLQALVRGSRAVMGFLEVG